MNQVFLFLFSLLASFSVVIIMVVICFFIAFLIWNGLPTLNIAIFFGNVPPLRALLGLEPVWDGIWPAVLGTLELIGITLSLAIIPGIGCGIFLSEYASASQSYYIRWLVDILSGIPSIVMGLFGFLLIIFLRHTIWPEANTCLLLAGGCLALLVLPTIIVTSQEAFSAVSNELYLSATALGFTKEQFIWFIKLPAASRGLWGGVLLAISRSAEDTAVILLTGVVANAGLPSGLGSKFEALPFIIYYTATQYQTQQELSQGFGAIIVLLFLIVSLFCIARLIGSKIYRFSYREGKCL
ncbi:ABC transporter permease subunit [Lawsonia intracellularis]|uniref:Phosphate ABC transporter, permease protein n=1 Tax=Lawsonia intracellularis (strain PHE/MN1-00) TaxID=363253 RepID=Q1MPJ3_LAWIP|nr:ABC transporter permease subunit [Lawsonia intracellularis]AGC50463.1 phosphate ABC transporter, permease [Lawsonia intracellularis N343]KAA0204483.1 phosphate ABC transporter permease [Lawsonia intracellularis]MBZ3892911.1 ABC transporter permease subunit [Lawsonia intracellularis]RBN32932.1 ABC transporter permease subunit [Lawsonia intracellularis]RBN35246.1 ABC transporter permease subunit [Lawsonia intracellularis]